MPEGTDPELRALLGGDVRAADQLPGPGDVVDPVRVDVELLQRVLPVAAALAAGAEHRRQPQVVWVEGDSQLALVLGKTRARLDDGRIDLVLPVRCDETGDVEVVVTLAVGHPERPAGVFAATPRRPDGPPIVVDAWGDVLVAFAWEVMLVLATQLAASRGRDRLGQPLVPVELQATRSAVVVVPMGRWTLPTPAPAPGRPSPVPFPGRPFRPRSLA